MIKFVTMVQNVQKHLLNLKSFGAICTDQGQGHLQVIEVHHPQFTTYSTNLKAESITEWWKKITHNIIFT